MVFTPQPTQEKLESYLKLQLDPKTQGVISMKQMQEVLLIPAERITPIPNLPACVVGLLNQRSRVFWLIDLANLLGLSPLEPEIREYNVAIIKAGGISMGLVVRKVQGVIRFSEESIESPIGTVLAGVVPYLRGCILQPQDTRYVLVLDAAAIIHAPIFEGK